MRSRTKRYNYMLGLQGSMYFHNSSAGQANKLDHYILSECLTGYTFFLSYTASYGLKPLISGWIRVLAAILDFLTSHCHQKYTTKLNYTIVWHINNIFCWKSWKRISFHLKIEKSWRHLGFSPWTGYSTCRRQFSLPNLDSPQNFA